MPVQTNLQRRGATYYFRARVPRDLLTVIPVKELKRSLAITDPGVARRRGARALQLAQDLFDTLRREPMLTKEKKEDIVRKYYEACLDEDQAKRTAHPRPQDFAKWLGTSMQIRDRMDEVLRSELASGYGAFSLALLDELNRLVDKDLNVDELMTDGEFRHLFSRALLAVNRVCKARDEGRFYQESEDLLFKPRDAAPVVAPAMPPIPPGAANGFAAPPFTGFGVPNGANLQAWQLQGLSPDAAHSVADLTPEFIKAKKGKVVQKTLDDYAHSLALLSQVVGPKAVGLIIKNDIVNFKDKLEKTPLNFKQQFKTDQMAEAIEKNEKLKEPYATIGGDTINEKYLANVKTFFEWALKNNIVRENPAKGVRAEVEHDHDAAAERDPFTLEELKTIFSAPLFTGCHSEKKLYKPGSHRIRDHRFWASLLSYTTGARSGELGQLEIADVTDEWGVPHLNITTLSDERRKQKQERRQKRQRKGARKRVKTPAGKRRIPLHAEILKLGFLDYVADMKTAGHTRVFPKWKPCKKGYYSQTMHRFFNERFLDRIGVKHENNSFHSFRHNFKDLMKGLFTDPTVQDVIMGHSNDSVQARYGSGEVLQSHSEALQKIKFPGVDWSKLKG